MLCIPVHSSLTQQRFAPLHKPPFKVWQVQVVRDGQRELALGTGCA
jgi:hypothetical protein